MQQYEALGTEPEDAFDDVTALAADLFDAPMALVSLVGEKRQWFKSERGLGIRETCIAASFCVHAIKSSDPTVILDAREDERVAQTPLVTNEPYLRFYAGAPLKTPDGHHVGTLCVLDTEPRTGVDDAALRHLERLAGVVVDEFELRREIEQRAQRESELETARASAEQARREAEDARDEAEQVNEAMTRFFAGVTHDLRTPLTRIRLFTNLVERAREERAKQEGEASDDETIPPYLDKILAATERMDRLVDLLLDLAWLRSGKVDLEVEPTDLQEVMKDAVADLQATPEAQAREFSVDFAASSLVANVDESAFRRVVQNLVENALKYTSPGDRVSIRLRSCDTSEMEPSDVRAESPVSEVVDADGPHDAVSADDASEVVVVEIEDGGPGIAPEKLDTLFDPFTRVSTDVDGVGLGLTVAHDLVTAMGGTIEVDSTLGAGTCFRITFPTPKG